MIGRLMHYGRLIEIGTLVHFISQIVLINYNFENSVPVSKTSTCSREWPSIDFKSA